MIGKGVQWRRNLSKGENTSYNESTSDSDSFSETVGTNYSRGSSSGINKSWGSGWGGGKQGWSWSSNYSYAENTGDNESQGVNSSKSRSKSRSSTRGTGGGSTGGGAVAVAARLSPLELGSDIGGSVRNPAHFNGIFSLKPTEWRVPSHGHVPDLPGMTRTVRYMGTFGPLARSVDDLEVALRIIAGPDGYEAEAPPVPLGPTPKLSAKGLRIAALTSSPTVCNGLFTAPLVTRRFALGLLLEQVHVHSR